MDEPGKVDGQNAIMTAEERLGCMREAAKELEKARGVIKRLEETVSELRQMKEEADAVLETMKEKLEKLERERDDAREAIEELKNQLETMRREKALKGENQVERVKKLEETRIETAKEMSEKVSATQHNITGQDGSMKIGREHIDLAELKRGMDGLQRKRIALGEEETARVNEGVEEAEEKRGGRSTMKRARIDMDLAESSEVQHDRIKQPRMSDDVRTTLRKEPGKIAIGKNLMEKEAATEETFVEKPMKTPTTLARSRICVKKDSVASSIGVQSDPLLEASRKNRMAMYRSDRDVFEKFPQLERNVNILLSDFAHSIGKSLRELLAANEELWKKLAKIKNHLTPKELSACEAHAAQYDDADTLYLMYLVAYLSRSRKHAKLDRVMGLFLKVHSATIDTTLADAKYPTVIEHFSALYLTFDDHAITIEGGLREAILALVAVTSLFNVQFDEDVSDIASFFYLAAGARLPDAPKVVVETLKIVRD